MIYAGLDVGSRTIALVTLGTGVMDSIVLNTGVNPLRRCQELLAGRSYGRLVVTGYGRHLVAFGHGERIRQGPRAMLADGEGSSVVSHTGSDGDAVLFAGRASQGA